MGRLLKLALSFAISSAGPLAHAQAIKTRAIKIYVKGMVCAFCAQGLTKTFQSQKGVLSVDARLEDGAVVLQVREDAPLANTMIEELVKDAGFDVLRIEAVPPTT